ncbi:MAG TPA: NAD(P)-dependent alcohol dehydrogenase [Anaeromyxobacteraceae bacterium]|nr:NAD(P)-dependent alcohol dehydrogenase [Anaeromyxobacteraceae bacterium]
MKAWVYDRFGPPEVLRLTDVPKPVPGDHEVLVRIRAMTVTAGDWRVRSLEVPRGFRLMSRLALGFSRPRFPILGTEISGEVEAIGKAVTRFQVGDPVFGFTGTHMGCHAEYRCLPEEGHGRKDEAVALKPANLGWEEAAALSFGGTTALSFFRKARLEPGERVLVVGASGAVGTAAVQLARHLGARVTGVCSTANLELVLSIGAERAIDYTREDFTRSGERWDVIVDTAGTAPFPRSEGSLADGGRLLVILGSLPEMLRAPWVSLTTRKKVIGGVASWSVEDLRLLANLAETGQFRPVIDRRYRFDEMIEAHRHVDAGHKRGNVVVTV